VVGQPVTFQDTTSGPHTVVGWTFATGNPATSTAQNPTVTWSSPGTFTVTLTVTRKGSATSAQQQISIQPTVPALTIRTTVLAGATVGQPYSQTLTAKGGAGSYTWTASNLPAWLSGTENGVGNYTLTGTPPGPPGVTNQFKVTVSAGTQTVFNTYTINVADPGCAGNTVTQSGNGTGQIVKAPLGCTKATFDVQGGIGGGAGTALFTEDAGASADITIADYPVTDGEQFYLGSGGAGTSGFLGTNGVGGSNPAGIPGGGGAGGTCVGVSGGGGGGESVVYRGMSPTTGTPLVVAAGGGGAGGGAAGGDSGQAGRAQHNASVGGGLPGTAIAGGAAGGGNASGGGNQSGGTGDSSCTDGFGGGGGGSGYFGGGGGGDGDGGGGGSNFVDPSISSSTVTIGTYFESLPNTVTVTWS
jgi:PKD repeat protein